MKTITIGSSFEKVFTVTEEQLANHVGSGAVNVLATPMMIMMMEQTACDCLAPFLENEETSVGTMIHTTHDAATPQGMNVTITAEISAVERRRVSFRIVAQDESDTIGIATHERYIIHQPTFEAKAAAKHM